VLGVDGFAFGVGAVTRPPVEPPLVFPPTPPPAAPPPVPPAPLLCAHAPATMPNAIAAPSAKVPIFFFMISS
jgi:hypothetical protein